MKNKKIIIAGGAGFIGRNIAQYFGGDNEIVILTRNNADSTNNAFASFKLNPYLNVRMIEWDGRTIGAWASEIDGSDVVINLAGKSVNCRYSTKNKQEIFDSRVNATKVLGEAIRRAIRPPDLWINAASATIYRDARDRPQDEFTGEMHNDFSVQVCRLWEQTFFDERTSATRKIALRMAITLGAGGVMIPYLNLVKYGLGGHQGSGSQMYSWVHIHDVCRVIDFVVHRKNLEGVLNVCAPNPVTNKVFMGTLRKIAGTTFGLIAYKWMLKIGAAIIGTETELILKSRWVIPSRLLQEGFTFRFAQLEPALKNIIAGLPRRMYHLF